MKVIIAIIIAVLLFMGQKIILIGLKRLLNRYSGIRFGDNMKNVTGFIIWLGYIFWATDFLFKEKFYFNYLVYIMILMVAGFFTWFFLMDLFAGIIFRIRHNLKTCSYIRAGDFSGQVKSQKLTYLKLMTDEGQIIRIPYSRIIHKVITELAYPGTLEEHIIDILVDLSSGRASDAESLIRTAILNSPWSNLKDEPTIKYVKEDEKGYYFEITLLSINIRRMKYIEMTLEDTPLIKVLY